MSLPTFMETNDLKELLDNRTIVTESGCHEWTGAKHDWGYGIVSIGGKNYYVHRLTWELENGPIPKGLMVRHYVCNNPPCRNNEHLRLGTHLDNMADMVRAGRQKNGSTLSITHCPANHDYTIKNTRIYRGRRHCRECDRIRSAIRLKKRKGASTND